MASSRCTYRALCASELDNMEAKPPSIYPNITVPQSMHKIENHFSPSSSG